MEEQIKENEKPKALYPKDEIKTTTQAKAEFDTNNGIVYLGKNRSKKWFEGMYEKFCDKIIYWQGKYIDVGRQLADYHNIDSGHMVWPIGSPVCFPYQSKVTSVLQNGAVLISNGWEYGDTIIIHVYGLKGTFVSGQIFPADLIKRLIYAGTFEYTASSGGEMTVPSLTPYELLTKEQFIDAFDSGIKLVEYENVIKDNHGKIYSQSEYKISDYQGDLTIQRGGVTVKTLKSGEHSHEIIGKPIR